MDPWSTHIRTFAAPVGHTARGNALTPTRDAESIDKKNDTRRVTIRITHHCGPMHTLEFP